MKPKIILSTRILTATKPEQQYIIRAKDAAAMRKLENTIQEAAEACVCPNHNQPWAYISSSMLNNEHTIWIKDFCCQDFARIIIESMQKKWPAGTLIME